MIIAVGAGEEDGGRGRVLGLYGKSQVPMGFVLLLAWQ